MHRSSVRARPRPTHVRALESLRPKPPQRRASAGRKEWRRPPSLLQESPQSRQCLRRTIRSSQPGPFTASQRGVPTQHGPVPAGPRPTPRPAPGSHLEPLFDSPKSSRLFPARFSSPSAPNLCSCPAEGADYDRIK
ncbi:hypothetical protein NDU88_002928 [Pleurodeles waltl]|uniref:Uncharacterized protein n=1 Tax=Pleurodeles waltl TaxID=8319 RepID=A0AAV7T3S9_PLEWA|nr:hypothetical protein NDU88_002928 [Pleurodeles waltl]